MASWTNQSTSSLLPGEPWTSAKALAAFENPTALAEGAAGAPILSTGWHGHNAVTVGDGNTGLFYNGASLTFVECPNFADGYEYRILGREITFTPSTSTTMVVEYLIGGAWETIYTSTASSTGPLDFDLWIRSPRRSARRFVLDYSIAFASTSTSWGPSNGTQENGLASIADNNAAVVTRARFSFTSRTANGGQAYLLRRREF
jgi:hypothetical protein